jgi:hypothetical protein
MGLLDDLGGIVKQMSSGSLSDADVHSAFDKTAASVPQGTLADGLAHAFNSDQTPPFAEMVKGLFANSSAEQKAGVLNQILSSLGPGVLSQLAGAGGLGSLASIVASGQTVTPQQAQQVSPESVQVLAQHAAGKDPSVVDSVASFYAQHSTLVKAIGAGALALVMSKISQSRR